MALYKNGRKLYGPSCSNISDTAVTQNSTFSSKKINELTNLKKITCVIGAHRGYHAKYPQNTIAAYRAAYEAGFQWCEIDIRVMKDGMYVMSHDNAITLYNNGVATAVNLKNSNYQDIKDYTWDTEGLYRINTLSETLAQTKDLDAVYYLDCKNDTEECRRDIIEIAARMGVIHRCWMLLPVAMSDVAKKYPELTVTVPVGKSEWSDIVNYRELYPYNKCYVVVNVSSSDPVYIGRSISRAQVLGLPIVACGITESNQNMFVPYIAGMYANLDLNFTCEEFVDMLKFCKNGYGFEIAINKDSLSLSVGDTDETLIGSTSASEEEGAGWVYAYSEDPAVCDVYNISYGASATIRVTGISEGTTNAVFFCSSGDVKKIPITVGSTENSD